MYLTEIYIENDDVLNDEYQFLIQDHQESLILNDEVLLLQNVPLEEPICLNPDFEDPLLFNFDCL